MADRAAVPQRPQRPPVPDDLARTFKERSQLGMENHRILLLDEKSVLLLPNTQEYVL